MEWKEVRLGDVIDYKKGFAFKSSMYKNTGTYIVRVSDTTANSVDVSLCNCISPELAHQYTDYSLKTKDIIIATVGSWPTNPASIVGKVVRVPESANNALLNQNAVRIRSNGIVDSDYLYYLLKEEHFSKYLVGTAQGSANQASITLKDIFGYSFSAPSEIKDQHRIASILSSLDRKIELNNKINADLEEMAQAIFKSWFVDFEPFKDGKFVDSELGMIPEGWKVGTLRDITNNKTAKVKERNDVKVLSPVTSGELVLSEEYFTKQVFSSSIAKYKIVNKGDFAYNPARVNIGSIGRNEFDFYGCVSPVYVVFSVLEGYENYFDLFRKTDFFKDSVASLAIGGVRQSLSYDDLSLIETIIPSKNIVEKFNNLYNQMKKTIKANKLENSRLSLLRDTLLPRLMSGELEVPE